MLLVVAATEQEMQPLRGLIETVDGVTTILSGMGVVEAAGRLAHYLGAYGKGVKGALNFGVAGAYTDTGLDLMDIVLAREERLADIGICMEDRIVPFEEGKFPLKTRFNLEGVLLAQAETIIGRHQVSYQKGVFLTVAGTSGTKKRGDYLRDTHHALCENMEGAAIARVCELYAVPLLELRCISNLVTDRGSSPWHLARAAERCAATVAMVLPFLIAGTMEITI